MAAPKKNQTDLSKVPNRFNAVDPNESPKEGAVHGVSPEYQSNLYAVPEPPARDNADKKDDAADTASAAPTTPVAPATK